MRFLVTGSAGFIGSTLTDALLADGHEVVGVDCFTEYYDVAIKQRNIAAARDHDAYTLLELDLATDELPEHALTVDGVFHQAAQAGVRASWGSEFRAYTDWNVLGTQRLLEALVQAGRKSGRLPRVVYASSSSVYGNAEARPTREDALPAPVSPYGVTKLAAEHLMATYSHNFGLETVSLRYFTVFGPRQRPDMAFHRFIRAGLEGREITVYGDGTQSRDFTFIDDIVAANRAAMDTPDLSCEVLNLGGGTVVTVREVLDLLGEVLGQPLAVNYGETQLGDVRHTSADTSRARATIGFEPREDLRTGLEREAAWLRELLAALPRVGTA
jgi:nucleoside-diphosphate-sugar epimerase